MEMKYQKLKLTTNNSGPSVKCSCAMVSGRASRKANRKAGKLNREKGTSTGSLDGAGGSDGREADGVENFLQAGKLALKLATRVDSEVVLHEEWLVFVNCKNAANLFHSYRDFCKSQIA